MADKLLAEWFWIDRWIGSSAFLLPIDARGLYREMLTQSWRREARLPNDHEAIRRAVGVTIKEWSRCWPLIERFWRTEGLYLVNDTQLEVYADAKARQERASNRGLKGAQAKHKQHIRAAQPPAQAGAQAPSQAPLKDQPPSLTPDADHRSPGREEQERRAQPREPIALAGTLPRDHLTHAWCSSRGKCVPQFLHQQFVRAVGGEERTANQQLRTFYAAVEAGWPAGPIGDPPVKLWEKEFAAKFPSVAPQRTNDTGSGFSNVTDAALRAVREAGE